jgi:hypothetical protein
MEKRCPDLIHCLLMNRSGLDNLREWFSGFTRAFYSAEEGHQRNIILKVEHTHLVCENMVRIALEERPEGALLGEAIALLHDVGRFPQYARYGTFRDAASVNHGELGARVLEEEGILGGLPPGERGLILAGVKYHNAFRLPRLELPGALDFLRLIRDADKLDIWRVFVDYYALDEGQRASAVGLGLPDTGEYSEETLSYIKRGELAPLATVKTLEDFKLVHLSWVYDLNFRATHRLLLERGYIGKLAAHLPRTGEIAEAVRRIEEFVRGRADA